MAKRFPIILIVILIGLFISSGIVFLPSDSYGYNKPWDQGHDSTDPDDPEDPEEPPEPPCDDCEKNCYGSPVSCSDGNYIYKTRDLFIPGNIPLDTSRTYNSRDNFRSGLFGYGWSSNFEIKLVYITEDTGNVAKILMPNGQRYDFTDNGDGTFTPPLGVYQTLTINPDGTYTLREKDGTRYEFDTDGTLTRIVARNSNQVAVSYDNGCPNTLSDSAGRTLDIVKGPKGKIATITDFTGRTIAYSYDSDGNLTSVTDPDGNTTSYNYDSEHNLISIIDKRGNTIASISYYSDGKVNRVIDGEGDFTYNYISSTQTRKTDNTTSDIWTYNYDSKGVVTSIQGPLGYTKSTVFDTNYNLISETDANGNTTSYTYNADGNIASKTDALGNTFTYSYIVGTNWLAAETDLMGHDTKYDYDANGNNIKITRDFGGALENTTLFTYDGTGNQTSMTDPLGNMTTYTYDANGNITQATDPLGNVSTYTYDSLTNKLTETDPLGNTTTYVYDILNRLTSITDALGSTSTLTYDANNNLISMTDASGNTTTNVYDSSNNLIQIVDPLGKVTQFTYDAKGNRTSITDANGNTTNYTYNALNQLTNETNALGSATNYSYDANGNRLTVTDANGNTTSNTYDALNRVVKTNYPNGTFESFSYDAEGKLINSTDRNGNIITLAYDSLHRMTVKSYPDSSTVNLSYDINGNILTAVNSDVSYTFTYDTLNRVTQVTNGTLGKNVSYSYLCCGLKGSMTDPEGGVTTYAYDALKRLISLTNPQGETTNFTYDSLSRTVRKDLANGNYTNYSYDSASRLLYLINKTSTDSVISSYNYTYDNTSNRTSMTTATGTHNYSYDKIYELLQATRPSTSTETFTYDPVYNRLSSANYSNWIYNNNNQLISFNGTNYTYDANGNTLSKIDTSGVTTYQYDYENKLTRIDYPDGTYSEYGYDPFGNRIKKDVNGTVEWFVYDLMKKLPDVIAEYDASDSLIVSYTHGPGVDEVISMWRTGNSYYYLKDGLGSITSLVDSSETMVNAYEYDAFGNVINQTSSVVNPYGYTGRRLDSESGLMYYRARYYDPSIGRFITVDPIGLIGGINYYIYVRNNAINRVDPSGLLVQETSLSGSLHWGVGGTVAVTWMQEYGDGLDMGIKLCIGGGVGGSASATLTTTFNSGNLTEGPDVSVGLNGTAIASWFGGAVGTGGCNPSISSLIAGYGHARDCDDILGGLWRGLNCGVGAGGAAGFAAGLSGNVTGCVQYVW